MIISTKIWKSCNYRGFILLFVHPAHFSDCRNAVKKIRGCVFTTHPLLYKGIKNLIRALPLGEAFASRQ